MSVIKLFRLSSKKLTKGEVGLEIEVEGERLPQEIPGWRRENDGSLRGESAEYVLARPCPRGDVSTHLKQVTQAYQENRSRINNTDRAGVHVHINVQDMQVHEVITFVCLYLTFEDMLVRYCGESRIGNLFCLRMRDAEGILKLLNYAIVNRHMGTLSTDQLRYASINLLAMHNYGSVEFRAMRTTTDMDIINTWVDILLKLKDHSRDFKHPRDFVEQFSSLGPRGLFDRVLLGHKNRLTYPDYDTDMWENIRNVQEIAYCVNWDEWIEWEHAIDNPINPFNSETTQLVSRPTQITAAIADMSQQTFTGTSAPPPPPPPTPNEITEGLNRQWAEVMQARFNTAINATVNLEDLDL